MGTVCSKSSRPLSRERVTARDPEANLTLTTAGVLGANLVLATSGAVPLWKAVSGRSTCGKTCVRNTQTRMLARTEQRDKHLIPTATPQVAETLAWPISQCQELFVMWHLFPIHVFKVNAAYGGKTYRIRKRR
jgi:hypothetical protein